MGLRIARPPGTPGWHSAASVSFLSRLLAPVVVLPVCGPGLVVVLVVVIVLVVVVVVAVVVLVGAPWPHAAQSNPSAPSCWCCPRCLGRA